MGSTQSTSTAVASSPNSTHSAITKVKLHAPRQHVLPSEDFQHLRQRWTESIAGSNVDLSKPNIQDAVDKLSVTAQQYLDDITPNGSQIWPDLNPIQLSVNFRKSYDRLRTIALAYAVIGTTLHGKSEVLEMVLQSLDFISAEIYNASTVIGAGENWWNYKIGSTRPLVDIGILLYDDLGQDRRRGYATTVLHMIGDLNQKSLMGANRAHMCQAVIGAGLLTDDEGEVVRGRNGLSDFENAGRNSLFSYVTNGEGFYEDGSYISHHVYPYTGGYAVSHLLALSQILHILHDSSYAIPSKDMSMLYDSIEKTFVPVVFRGMVMGHVRGRNIARKSESDADAGSSLMQALVRFSAYAPEPYNTYFRSLVKSWNEVLPSVDLGDSDITMAAGIQGILSDGVAPAEPSRGLTIMPMSDRVMFHQQKWSASIAMSSTRTGRYETLNSENLSPFYQGDGFLQLYLDNDRTHYIDDYYPTMDPYHTPGVTSGRNPQLPAKYRSTAYNDWAGGVTWKELGSASLSHQSNDRGSSAKKSWFFLLNAITALGTNCTGSSGTELHTTYESRNLARQDTSLLVDGVLTQHFPFQSWSQTYSNPSWAHIDGIGGYLFPDSENITFERANRTGRWTDINQYPDYAMFNESVTREYLTIYRNHGIDPIDGTYTYTILPNTTVETTAYVATHPESYILSNTPIVQAIAFNDNHTQMATFWEPGTLGVITAQTPCAIAWGYIGVQDRNYTVTLSDPSQKLKKLSVWLEDEDIGSVLEVDSDVSLSSSGGHVAGIGIEVSCNGGRGRTYTVVFERVSWRGVIG